MLPSKLKSLYLSFALAFLCLFIPWSGVALKVRPDFVLLVIIFWLIRAPNLCNVGTAWFLGIFVDLANGGIFGQYALAYTITAFFAVTYQRRLVLFSLTQQLFYVLLLLIIAQMIMLILKVFSGADNVTWDYFLPSLTGIFLWQAAFFIHLNAGSRARDSS